MIWFVKSFYMPSVCISCCVCCVFVFVVFAGFAIDLSVLWEDNL